ncbi:MAG: phytanoyl-CoA dioxygenase family protein [Ectothiorhodospiraceae bacterium]|nr:phytanoyl-CoA dioxygenase family protein [Chromatiales bacterium]MCP5155713.1 phytanoyl-CoA dioxygenase family protein [Ectothiorhodospiraceae bacterium]
MRAALPTDAEVAAFHRDGYLVVPGLLDAEEMRRVTAWTEDLAAMPEVPGRHMVYHEDSLRAPGQRVLSRIENFCPFHEGMDRLLRGPGLGDWVARLMGEPVVLFKEKINFKIPGSDGFKAHQDVQAGWDVYGPLHVTALVTIDDTTPENGCLELAAGRHREGLLGEMWKPLPEDGSIEYVACPTRSGDVVFFDSYAPHRSAPNATDRPRRVLYVTYNARSAGDHRLAYYAAKRKSFPPDCEREPGARYVFRV